MRNASELLEWPVLEQRLARLTDTPYGAERWQTHVFLETIPDMEDHLAEVWAFSLLLQRYGEPTSSSKIPVTDLRPVFHRIGKGGLVTVAEAGQVLAGLSQAAHLLRHIAKGFQKEHEQKSSTVACLSRFLMDVFEPGEVIAFLETKVSPEGDILETASPELAKLRQKFRNEKKNINEKLQAYLHNPEHVRALQSTVITEREGRLVLPVRVEFKTEIPGVVHAGSGTGSTLYVEPYPVVELNNQLQTTETAIQQEISKILSEISSYLKNHFEELLAYLDRVGEIDKRLAGARLTLQLDATVPTILKSPGFDLKKVRHPLLVFQDKHGVVPNDIVLGDEQRTMIITGPNTGGKTVLLKTIGLCAVMLKAGLPVPVGEGSAMSLFDPVLADIGDQQNISQNLSTFSAHLSQLQSFLDESTPLHSALVLVDEICAGTDPGEGAALARAILNELHERGAVTLVTTHLGELKLEAHDHPGYVNASVAFDAESLRPTYRLMMGVPGASHAITIAERYGISKNVIDNARRTMGNPLRESSALLEELEEKTQRAQEELLRAENYRRETQTLHDKLAFEHQQLQENKRKMIATFRSGLSERMTVLENELKSLKKDLENQGAESLEKTAGRVKRLRKKAGDMFNETTDAVETEDEVVREEDLSVGEEVKTKRLGMTGTVLEILKGSGEVVLGTGNLKMTVPLEDIQKLSAIQKKYLNRSKPVSRGSSKIPKPSGRVSGECDVRGMRAEEALTQVEQYLDDASLANLDKIGIIHGFGTGALKKAIREFLKNSPLAKKYYPAEPNDGGDGKTIVEL